MRDSEEKIVITGLGVIAPNAIGKEDYWQALNDGLDGVKKITQFDTSDFKVKHAAECSSFDAKEILGKKGLRNIDRKTLLLCCAAKMALDDAGYSITEENNADIGASTGTTLSVAWDMLKFTQEMVDEGPNMVNPALFPPTTMNFPSSQMSIKFGMRGFNTTISTGYTASLDSLAYAITQIRDERVNAALVCGVESLSISNFIGFDRIGFLAGINGPELSCPFDQRHNGIILGEGSAVLLVESERSALSRGAHIYAEVSDLSFSFDSYRTMKYSRNPAGLITAIKNLLHSKNILSQEIDSIFLSANSATIQDYHEAQVVKEIFRDIDVPACAIKSMIGETISADGCFQIAAALG
ncbi:MAG: beta-ketoacyl synthase N-terminal-like domain-containing protein, partial [Candidatus Omnitrophica bacterium]|nr:beta-ketoacyl synthase N-terminal-like domain-containing protein [Candidatus Omnitrophota bacterium]